MKKTILLSLLAVLFSLSSFAQDKPATTTTATTTTTTTTKSETTTVVVKDLNGKVDSVVIADAAKNIKAQLVIVTEKGAKVTFIVSSKAMIMSAGQMVTLDKIAKNSAVAVKYHVAHSGANEATDITVK